MLVNSRKRKIRRSPSLVVQCEHRGLKWVLERQIPIVNVDLSFKSQHKNSIRSTAIKPKSVCIVLEFGSFLPLYDKNLHICPNLRFSFVIAEEQSA